MDGGPMCGPGAPIWREIGPWERPMALRSAERRRGPFRWIDRLLIVVGLACLLFYAGFTLQTEIYQRLAKAEIDRIAAARGTAGHRPMNEPMIRVRPGELIGRVDVPRLQLSAAVAEGDDDSTLGRAVGHLPDTAMPWQREGNVAFAAHRDGLFRPLKDIRI